MAERSHADKVAIHSQADELTYGQEQQSFSQLQQTEAINSSLIPFDIMIKCLYNLRATVHNLWSSHLPPASHCRGNHHKLIWRQHITYEHPVSARTDWHRNGQADRRALTDFAETSFVPLKSAETHIYADMLLRMESFLSVRAD